MGRFAAVGMVLFGIAVYVMLSRYTWNAIGVAVQPGGQQKEQHVVPRTYHTGDFQPPTEVIELPVLNATHPAAEDLLGTWLTRYSEDGEEVEERLTFQAEFLLVIQETRRVQSNRKKRFLTGEWSLKGHKLTLQRKDELASEWVFEKVVPKQSMVIRNTSGQTAHFNRVD